MYVGKRNLAKQIIEASMEDFKVQKYLKFVELEK